MSDVYERACSEVLAIIPYLDEECSKKIPTKFIKKIEEISDKEYIPNIDKNKNLKEQELLEETRAILALIYRDYLCTKEEREKLILQEKEERIRIEKEKQEKYKIDFGKKAESENKQSDIIEKIETEEKELIEITEEKWYQKIINKILKIFKIGY
jgi:hypothetical protein